MMAVSEKMNDLGQKSVPFLFIIDFEMKRPRIVRLDEVDSNQILFYIGDQNNATHGDIHHSSYDWRISPISFTEYQKAFQHVQQNQRDGNSYLTNLTFPTELFTDLTLKDIFTISRAKYKLMVKDEFVVFSPETFVNIHNGTIHSYPMKGTIDASLPKARERLLNDEKEKAEHHTIVDLIRNDLSMVSTNVEVTTFRYVDYLHTSAKDLLQVSSEITGELATDYPSHIGDIIATLLPAGSISGAPKKKTVEIIREAEKRERGYYTGVAGIFDGRNLDSFVMIRFIEKQGNRLFYRSGGGITVRSEVKKEYSELIDKVYVPVA